MEFWFIQLAVFVFLIPGCKEGRKAHHLQGKDGQQHGHSRGGGSKTSYMKRLDSKERVTWQKPDQVIKALGLKGDEVIIDLGAGTGFFAFRFAKAVPRGRVEALDVDTDMVELMKKKLLSTRSKRVKIKKIDPTNPKINPSADLVFVNNVLHHVNDQKAWLKGLHSQMKKGARLVILEFKKKKLPVGPPQSMKMTKENIINPGQNSRF